MLTISTAVINDYIRCSFEGAFVEGWDDTYVDFIDLSGLVKTDEYVLLVDKHNLLSRTQSVPQYIIAQKECVRIFGKYHPHATERLAKKGYIMPSDVSKADAYLDTALSKEKMFNTKLREIESKLEKIKQPEGYDNKKARRSFIRLINSIGQRYTIDREKTTLEELALMIKEMADEAEQAALERLNSQFKQMR